MGCDRKTSLAAEQIAVISLFFRQTDFVNFALYPASSRRWIMSSISNVLGEPSGFVLDAFPFPLIEAEVPADVLDEDGKTEEMAAARPEEGCGKGFARIV